MGNMIAAGAVVVVALGIWAYLRLRPPFVSPMSDEWLDHTKYQLTKDGTSLSELNR